MAEGLGLADFLTDLREELGAAQQRAAAGSLRLGVDQIEISLDVTATLEKSGGVDSRVKAKFWVFASAEAGATGSVSSERSRTQHVKLILTPRVEEAVIDTDGITSTVLRGLDVSGRVGAWEESPTLPPPSGH